MTHPDVYVSPEGKTLIVYPDSVREEVILTPQQVVLWSLVLKQDLKVMIYE